MTGFTALGVLIGTGLVLTIQNRSKIGRFCSNKVGSVFDNLRGLFGFGKSSEPEVHNKEEVVNDSKAKKSKPQETVELKRVTVHSPDPDLTLNNLELS
jgi:hypothetical protein